ncbi:aminoglycoside phosphotransferase [Microbacterium sp. NPDC091313]
MDSTLRRLTEWMPRQRWYAAKGSTPRLRLIAAWDVGDSPDARVQLLLVADEGGVAPVLYQVPIVRRRADETRRQTAQWIGVVGEDDVLDGANDPAFQDVLFSWVTRGAQVEGVDGPLSAEPAHAPRTSVGPVPAAVLRGEQSNTSIIFRPPRSAPIICKLFRQVHAGLNPDIELQGALADAGIRTVPPMIGTVSGVWRDPRDEGHLSAGSLAFAQEFFPGVEDAWRVALQSAAADADFTGASAALGRAVASTHAALARLFPTRETDAADRDRAAAGWTARAEMAIAAVPELTAAREGIERVFARGRQAAWPRRQRVHGDLHLGQVLEVPERGWVLLDFEGEPLRPIAERHEPDFAVRDVAGMLRSFDYAAASVPADRAAWATASRTAFLDGYTTSTAAAALDADLLRAFELDKALYETVYEARNRPDWVGIPLAAVRRMAG